MIESEWGCMRVLTEMRVLTTIVFSFRLVMVFDELVLVILNT